jgi:hypothetical protein
MNAILTRHDVTEVLGLVDDDLIVQIIDTGAAKAELLEAHAWLNADDAMARDLHREPHGRIAVLCELISAYDAPDPDER